MSRKVVLLEDDLAHFETLRKGVEQSRAELEIVKVDLKEVVKKFKTDQDISIIPKNIDLFIIDVSLEKGRDEIGLEILGELMHSYGRDFEYIVLSIWDISEFENPISLDEKYFINKNSYSGFEMATKLRNTINSIFN